ncbi:expressed unknown protein [Seminavis robusta]|uniref:Uncharacterized protein n=1 Tax=Seminavis robusta TaxID=568900 RepID=A0A9N8HK49_9STRA|nr:expressed unknown protein [Seminavis robusta]|eukprot:Sro706_g190500.1 n/a (133) ;mRNA; r:46253-46651
MASDYVLASSDDAESRRDEEIPDYYEPIDDNDPAPLPELSEAIVIMQHEAFDKYIATRVCVPQGDQMSYVTVTKRKRNPDGKLIGLSNSNPLLDTSIYEVESDSGETRPTRQIYVQESIMSCQWMMSGYTLY